MARNDAGLQARPWATDPAALKQTPETAGLTRAAGFPAGFSVDQFMQLETFNGLLNEIFGLLTDIATHGLLEWSASQSPGYAHPCRVLGSDGAVYQSVQAGGEAQDPTSDENDAYWTLAATTVEAATEEARGTVRRSTDDEEDSGTSESAVPAVQGVVRIINRLVGPAPGDLKATAAINVPDGWLECDGSAVSRTTYATLYAAIGNAYGNGNGSTTFNLPDFRGRTIIGAGDGGAQLTNRQRGQTGGAETHTLTEDQLPAHDHNSGTLAADQAGAHHHDLPTNDSSGSGTRRVTAHSTRVGVDVRTSDAGAHHHNISGSTGEAGGGNSHNNMPPFAVARVLIKT